MTRHLSPPEGRPVGASADPAALADWSVPRYRTVPHGRPEWMALWAPGTAPRPLTATQARAFMARSAPAAAPPAGQDPVAP